MTRSELLKQSKSKYALIGVAVIVLLLVVGRSVYSANKPTQQTDVLGTTEEVVKKSPVGVEFPLAIGTNEEGLKISVVDAELRDSIILKGQKANAVEGRKFLIVNLKITNNDEKRVKLDTRDYVRLSVNGSEEKLAPSIHNDPVESQPISNQVTRVGFSVNESDSQFKLFIGEISKEKQEVELNFN